MRRWLGSLLAVLYCAPLLALAAEPAFGPNLEGFDYPYPVGSFAFVSQGKPVKMDYMDVRPAARANGRTVVVLHGKNFCGAT